MQRLLFSAFLIFLNFQVLSQINSKSILYNFDFEEVKDGEPIGWESIGFSNYQLALDSVDVHNGKYAASIEYMGDAPEYKAWTFPIKRSYKGQKITLSGYIKTENVTDGFAGLWMRIDPNVGYEDMSKVAFKGTNDWTRFEISLDLKPDKIRQILIGGLMVGKGKVWFDDFKVQIDQKEIQKLKPIKKMLFPADADKEFDEGSMLSINELNSSQIADLKLLCQMWGFLKYYHPGIAKGNYNWDYELFRVLPKIINAQNKTETEEIFLNWLDGFGKIQKSKQEVQNLKNIQLKPEFEWMNDSKLSDKIIKKLNEIKQSERSEVHYYVELDKNTSTAVFKNENEYLSKKYPDAGYRLLALFRYWNMVAYYFPYKNIIGKDWNLVLDEFIPRMVQAKNELEYTLTVLELIGNINDSHASVNQSQILNYHFGLRYAPVEVQYVENKVVVTAFHDQKFGEETQLKFGDIITIINGGAEEERTKKMLNHWPASNYPTQLKDIAKNFLRTNDSNISLQIRRDNVILDKVIKTYSLKEINLINRFYPSDTCFRMINPEIAYINNGTFKNSYIPEIWNKIKNTKGLIIDNRNYPIEDAYYEFCNYLLPQNTPFAKLSVGSIKYPGHFTFNENRSVGKKNEDYYKGKVIILVDENSQSASEFSAMAYSTHPNAIIIGSTTAGADGSTSDIYLPGGIYSRFTGVGVFYPDGKETQRVGIIPDIELRPTIEGIRAGQDELLLKAVELINKK